MPHVTRKACGLLLETAKSSSSYSYAYKYCRLLYSSISAVYFPSGKKGDSFATENTGLTACEIHRNVSKNVSSPNPFNFQINFLLVISV